MRVTDSDWRPHEHERGTPTAVGSFSVALYWNPEHESNFSRGRTCFFFFPFPFSFSFSAQVLLQLHVVRRSSLSPDRMCMC